MQKDAEYKVDGADTIVGLIAVVVAIPLNAWALSVLWTWFVVPLGGVSLGFWAAMGLNIVIGYARGSRGTQKYATESAYYQSVAATITFPLVALLMGVIVRGITP